ncbi:hypothetical protein [Viridibacillus arvi]|uniref:hypothetical protein n=1 Tax=Viridibacillus arvi TaxID=263475 RepID=UPI0034CDD142
MKESIVNVLNQLYEEGYRYVVRDKDKNYLICYSLKPKKYLELEAWGYVNPDAQGAIMAHPFENTDNTEITWSNSSATLISDYLAKNTL